MNVNQNQTVVINGITCNSAKILLWDSTDQNDFKTTNVLPAALPNGTIGVNVQMAIAAMNGVTGFNPASFGLTVFDSGFPIDQETPVGQAAILPITWNEAGIPSLSAAIAAGVDIGEDYALAIMGSPKQVKAGNDEEVAPAETADAPVADIAEAALEGAIVEPAHVSATSLAGYALKTLRAATDAYHAISTVEMPVGLRNQLDAFLTNNGCPRFYSEAQLASKAASSVFNAAMTPVTTSFSAFNQAANGLTAVSSEQIVNEDY